MAKVFISYQTEDRRIAGALARSLEASGLKPFMAHEDIQVSDEWRATILRELDLADVCVCLLSQHYVRSVWCLQEAGIAAFKRELIPIPLIIDGATVPPGFLSAIQGKRCNPDYISIRDVLPGLLLNKPSLGIDAAISLIGNSGSFRGAEANFELLIPHLGVLTESQARRLLTHIHKNDQVHYAGLCAQQYIPRTLVMYGRYISADMQQELINICNRFGANLTIEDIVP